MLSILSVGSPASAQPLLDRFTPSAGWPASQGDPTSGTLISIQGTGSFAVLQRPSERAER